MTEHTHEEWQAHLHSGARYLKTARGGLNRPSVFNNELIYHLTAMAIEKLLVSVYLYHRQLPADHTLDGLVDDLTVICPLETSLADSIKRLARFDDMCPLVPVQRVPLDNNQIKAMLAVGGLVADFAMENTN